MKEITYEDLYQLYIVEQKTIKEICDIYETKNNRKISNKLKEFNIPIVKGNRKTLHGMEGTRIYNSWINMKNSCKNESNSGFKYIGSMGITYDTKWETFRGFYEDMAEGYSDEKYLSRRNKNGNFNKDNCYWAGKEDVLYNRSDNIIIEIGKDRYTTKEVSVLFGIKEKTIHARYEKGWRGFRLVESIKESYITNIPHMRKFFENGGIKQTKQYIGFTESKKKNIRERDNCCCQECGMTNDECLVEYGCSLHVHHIDYDKANGCDTNLISLCVSCHVKTNNYNREYWTNYYQDKIKEQYS